MVRYDESVFCDGCGVEILWTPVVAMNEHFCCADCRDGRECTCGAEAEEEQRGSKNADLSIEGPY